MVSTASIVCIAISCVLGFAIPIALLLYFLLVKKADIIPYFIGCAVMVLFAFVLESLMHHAIIDYSPLGEIIQDNIWLFAIYGGLAAGIFEETGRFIAFKTVLKKYQSKDINALMYGAGHGGIECIMLLGITMINNIIYVVMINAGQFDTLVSQTAAVSPDAVSQLMDVKEQLVTASPLLFLAGPIERCSAITIQLSLSVMVWFAAKNKKTIWMYPLAIIFHAFVDGVTALLSKNGMSTAVVEILIFVCAVIYAIVAYRIYKSQTIEE